ncbi:hypothetical protein ACWEKT_20880 [Nocardia takedensis]
MTDTSPEQNPNPASSPLNDTHEQTFPVSAGARALGKSERWYIQQIKNGRFPGRKAGRTWFLTAGDIDAAIEASRTPPARPVKRQPPPQPINTRPSTPRPARKTRHRRYIPPQDR